MPKLPMTLQLRDVHEPHVARCVKRGPFWSVLLAPHSPATLESASVGRKSFGEDLPSARSSSKPVVRLVETFWAPTALYTFMHGLKGRRLRGSTTFRSHNVTLDDVSLQPAHLFKTMEEVPSQA